MDKFDKYDVSETDNNTLLVQGDSINSKEVEAPKGPYLVINGAWYVDQFPTMIVAEKIDGTLGMFYLTPFRKVRDEELKPYKGYHPRKMKGSPLPDYLYRFYGLERSGETLSEVIRVRISPSEKEKLEATAENDGKSVSEYLRGMIKLSDPSIKSVENGVAYVTRSAEQILSDVQKLLQDKPDADKELIQMLLGGKYPLCPICGDYQGNLQFDGSAIIGCEKCLDDKQE